MAPLTFFGSPWDAPVFRQAELLRVATPVGVPCLYCTEPIQLSDRGWIRPTIIPPGGLDIWDLPTVEEATQPIHRECELVLATGPLAHVQGRCTRDQQCYELMDNEGRSPRTDALAAWDWVATMGVWSREQLAELTVWLVDELTGDPDCRNRKEP